LAELALDDDQRHAFARKLDGMGVPELVGGEAPPDPRVDGGPAHVRPRRRATNADRVSVG